MARPANDASVPLVDASVHTKNTEAILEERTPRVAHALSLSLSREREGERERESLEEKRLCRKTRRVLDSLVRFGEEASRRV